MVREFRGILSPSSVVGLRVVSDHGIRRGDARAGWSARCVGESSTSNLSPRWRWEGGRGRRIRLPSDTAATGVAIGEPVAGRRAGDPEAAAGSASSGSTVCGRFVPGRGDLVLHVALAERLRMSSARWWSTVSSGSGRGRLRDGPDRLPRARARARVTSGAATSSTTRSPARRSASGVAFVKPMPTPVGSRSARSRSSSSACSW